VGGEPTTIERHPWQIALFRKSDGGDEYFTCGGSVVHGQWVLTAAHCVTEEANNTLTVVPAHHLRVGVSSTDRRNGKRVAIVQVFVHESYNPPVRKSLSDDIALLKLEAPVEARAVELAPEDIKLTPGDTLELTGWGSSKLDASGPLPTTLQRIELPYISYDTCNRPSSEGGQQGSITQDMLCVGATPGHGQCGGDSGGPLVRHTATGPVQVGVVSFSSRPCTTRVGVFTRVSSYREWIARIMAFN
jgi:secreted trypsin-like serine protease